MQEQESNTREEIAQISTEQLTDNMMNTICDKLCKCPDSMELNEECMDCPIDNYITALMNRLEQHEKRRWIPATERMPPEHDSVFAKLKGTDRWGDFMFEKISDDVNVTVESANGARRVITMHTTDGTWRYGLSLTEKKVIAWMPLPEPYRREE